MQKLIECVPNFSEGRDLNKINQITDSIKEVEGVTLLDIDSGQDLFANSLSIQVTKVIGYR